MIQRPAMGFYDQPLPLQILEIAPDRVLTHFEETRQTADLYSLISLQQLQNLDLPFFAEKAHLIRVHNQADAIESVKRVAGAVINLP